jgi:uncharacterized membrane protein YeaQ/YmgE (transglycosylase-associated protein family)
MMWWFIQFMILGLVAGAIARLLHPGRDPMNWFWTMLLGMAGALLGGWVGGLFGFHTEEGVMRWVAAVGGAIVLLIGYYFVTTKATPTGRVATNEEYKRAVFDDLARGPQH